MLYGLPKPFRLHLKKDFEAIIRNAYRLQGEGMVIWWRPSSYPGARTRLGIVVSRKLGGAVVRNRVKRLLRESYANLLKNGEIISAEKFCHNCGSKSFVAEKVDKINFIDISYAVLVKTVIMREDFEFTQSWAEARETSSCTRRLLQQFR